MYAFVHIEKTGGTTLHSILRRSFGTRHCDIRLPLAKRGKDRQDHRTCVEAADLRRVRRLYRNLRGISGHNVKAYSNLHLECPEIQFFTFFRDPAKRFRSHFLNRGLQHSFEDFRRWISATWLHNWQTKMIAGEPNADKAIELISTRFGFVGLTERFDESLVMLGGWLQEPGFRAEYRRRNQLSDKQRPRDLLREQLDMSYLDSDSVRAQIHEANSADQKVFDFVTRTVYPRQLAAFEGNLTHEVEKLQQLNRSADRLAEPVQSKFVRNYIYKPLLHCRVL